MIADLIFNSELPWREKLKKYVSDSEEKTVRAGRALNMVEWGKTSSKIAIDYRGDDATEVDRSLWFQILNLRHYELGSLRMALYLPGNCSKTQTLNMIFEAIRKRDEKTDSDRKVMSNLAAAVEHAKRFTQIYREGFDIIQCYGAIHLLRNMKMTNEPTSSIRFYYFHESRIQKHECLLLLVAPQAEKGNYNEDITISTHYPPGMLCINGQSVPYYCKNTNRPIDLAPMIFVDRLNKFDYRFELESDAFKNG